MASSSDVPAASTPISLVNEVYGRLPERAALGRERLGRSLTLTEKILLNHLRDVGQELERGRSYVDFEIGRASCRERVCQYVSISVVAVSLTKKQKTTSVSKQMSLSNNIALNHKT